MKKLTIDVPTELEESNYGEIELVNKGQIIVKSEHKSVKIEKLTNSKTAQVNEQGDILFCGQDGKDGVDGTGKDGKDGETVKGICKLTIDEVCGKISVQSGGGIGGRGGSGTDGDNGGKGGRGGNGSDAPDVVVKYGKADNDEDSEVYFFSSVGGIGGCGGNGGNSTLGFGIGGIAELPDENANSKYGTRGGVFGDGGDAGDTGSGGITVIHNPDGSYTINGEYFPPENTDVISGAINFGDPAHARHWIDVNGGIDTLIKCPEKLVRLLYTIDKKKSNAEADEVYVVTGDLVDAAIPVDEKVSGDNSDTHFAFNTSSNSFCNPNSALFGSDLSANDVTLPQITGCYISYLLDNLDENHQLVKSTTVPYDFEDDASYHRNQFSKEFNRLMYWGKYLRVTFNTTFILDNKYTKSYSTVPIEYETDTTSGFSFLRKVVVNDPKYQFTGQRMTDYIVILYGRTPEQGEPIYSNADYYGRDKNSYYYTNNNANALKTIIPITGEVWFKNKGDIKIHNVELSGFPATNPAPVLSYHIGTGRPIPAANYQPGIEDLAGTLAPKFVYDEASNKLKFEFAIDVSERSPYDWNQNLNIGYMDKTQHRCYLNCCFNILVTHDLFLTKTTSSYEINIGSALDISAWQDIWNESNENTDNCNTVDIPPIVIYWGCFSADAKIKVMQGTKRADEIKIGDKIEVYAGEILTVENIYTGEDETIFCIVTENNLVTKVSGGHAMKLYSSDNPDGVKIAAANIKPGDVLMTPNGNVTVKHCDEVPYGNTVYNFTFAEHKTPQYIEADGFWSGDFMAQNEG
jgi:hypothetical protein